MTDYTDLIARLRAPVPTVYDCKDAAAALEAQARRIAELESMLAVHRLAVDVDALKARIEELEAENEELKKAISKPWMGSARAAYLGEKE
jgi:cell division protein FtsB